jgi:hypothetical protein
LNKGAPIRLGWSKGIGLVLKTGDQYFHDAGNEECLEWDAEPLACDVGL